MFRGLVLRKMLLLGGDLTLLYLSLLLTVYLGFWSKFSWQVFSEHIPPFSILYFFWLIIFYIFDLYDFGIARRKNNFYFRIFGAILTNLLLGISFFYLFPLFNLTPKTNLVINLLIFGVLFLGWRKIFFAIFSVRLVSKMAIVGEGPQAEELAEEIEERPHLGYKLISLNPKQDLLVQVQEKEIDTLIVPTDLNPNSELSQSLYRCLPTRINFLDWARAYELICEKIPNEFLAQTWFLENLREGDKRFYDKLKRGLDLIMAGILLTISLPLFPFIALLVKLEGEGPIFYRQERIGKDGKPFFLFKFRSMEREAESKTGPVWAKKEDPRITKVGKFLRRAHLDELPQMINVIRGNLSLVGPRPERPEFIAQLEKEIPHYRIRHLIKPGFTGWAQIKFRYGRSVMDSQEKFQYDLYYLKNRSIFLDLGILLKTFQLFFKKD